MSDEKKRQHGKMRKMSNRKGKGDGEGKSEINNDKEREGAWKIQEKKERFENKEEKKRNNSKKRGWMKGGKNE